MKPAKTHKTESPLAIYATMFEAAKAHADEFQRLGRAAGQHAILCGMELIKLHETHDISQGKRADLSRSGTSWDDIIEANVGISRTVAYRWMQAARAQLPALMGRLGFNAELMNYPQAIIDIEVEPIKMQEAVAELTVGKTLEQLLLPLDGNGSFDPKRLTGKAKDAWEKIVALCDPYDDAHYGPQIFSQEEYDQMHDDALVLRQRIEAGEVPPTRAWAGMRGRAAADGKGGRSATDHYKNLNTALTKLRTSFAHWDDLGGEDRIEIETNWQELWKSVPGSIKSTIKKAEGWK